MADARIARRYAATIVRRDCHVSDSLLACVRHVARRLAKPFSTQRKAVRRALILGAADGRRDNIVLYRFAMRGRA
jgi:hypothetical protein